MALPTTPLFVDVPFRGERSYLQSANIFEFLTEKTGADRNLTLMFRQQIGHEIEAIPAATCSDVEACPARFTADTPDGPIDWVMVEREPKTPVVRREVYDEAAVIRDSVIDGACITSVTPVGSSIDRIVALNKRLIHETIKPGKKLLFAKAVLDRIPAPSQELKICLKTRLGNKLFRSDIFTGGEKVGEIVFYGV